MGPVPPGTLWGFLTAPAAACVCAPACAHVRVLRPALVSCGCTRRLQLRLGWARGGVGGCVHTYAHMCGAQVCQTCHDKRCMGDLGTWLVPFRGGSSDHLNPLQPFFSPRPLPSSSKASDLGLLGTISGEAEGGFTPPLPVVTARREEVTEFLEGSPRKGTARPGEARPLGRAHPCPDFLAPMSLHRD